MNENVIIYKNHVILKLCLKIITAGIEARNIRTRHRHYRTGESNVQNEDTHTGTKNGETNNNQNNGKTTVFSQDQNFKHLMMAS
jgi:hypothetical protein